MKKPARSLARAYLLARFILGALLLSAMPLHAQRSRADSIRAMAACWRFAAPPKVVVATSSCPDSAEAFAKMLPVAPVYHVTSRGPRTYMQVGQKLSLDATTVRGFFFVYLKGAPRFGMVLTPADQIGR